MKTMKVMSIIGVVWFTISLLFVIAFFEEDLEASAGWGMLGLLYAIPYAIVGIVQANKSSDEIHVQHAPSVSSISIDVDELEKLFNLKERGVINSDEYEIQKQKLLDVHQENQK